MGNFLKNRKLLSGSSGVVLPAGPTSDRPDHPTFGLIRYNTDSGLVEYFDGIIFKSLNTGAVTYTVDNFSGNGSQTVFTMSIQVSNATQIIVFVGSIYQQPTTTYTVDGGYDITFTSAPPNGVPINVIHTSG